MIRATLLALLLGSTTAAAEPSWPFDTVKLFADPPEGTKRVAIDGGEELHLPGGVVVTRKLGTIMAVDTSEGGAVGCLLNLMISFREIAAECTPLNDAEQQTATRRIDRVLRFSAENAWPPIALEDMRRIAEETMLPPEEPGLCARVEAEGWLDAPREVLAGPGVDAELDKTLATPRLPVLNPCL